MVQLRERMRTRLRSTYNRLDTNSKSRPWIERLHDTASHTVTSIFGNRQNLVRELGTVHKEHVAKFARNDPAPICREGVLRRIETVGVRWGWCGSRKKNARWNAALEFQRRVMLVEGKLNSTLKNRHEVTKGSFDWSYSRLDLVMCRWVAWVQCPFTHGHMHMLCTGTDTEIDGRGSCSLLATMSLPMSTNFEHFV